MVDIEEVAVTNEQKGVGGIPPLAIYRPSLMDF